MVKKLTFCKLLYQRKCKTRGVGGQKKSNLVNLVCERPLALITLFLVQTANLKSSQAREICTNIQNFWVIFFYYLKMAKMKTLVAYSSYEI